VRVLAALALLLTIAVVTASGHAASPDRPSARTFKGHGAEYWHWQYKLERRAHRRTISTRIAAVGSHPLERAFLCIKSFEGAWRSNTGNGYYGGMQMDLGFQRSYGSEFLRAWGTADNWPVSVQLAVAMRAYLSGRGFYPWPNTARYCGLIR
jgi:hypothetical protein